MSNTLNVIFHGPCIFVVYDDRVEVLLPYVDGHSYGAGNWMSEYILPSGAISLNGLAEQTNSTPELPDPTEAVFIDAATLIDIDPRGESHATFVLKPRPQAIRLLRPFFHQVDGVPQGDLGTTLFDGPAKGLAAKVQKLGSAHYATYQLSATDALKLSNLPLWSPARDSKASAFNLHVFGTSVFDGGMMHSVAAFDSLVDLLSGLILSIQPVTIGEEPPHNVDGIPAEQQVGLRDKAPGTKNLPPVLCDAPSVFVIVS